MQENEIQVLVQNEIQRLFTTDPAAAIMIAAKAIEQANQKNKELETYINKDLMPKAEMYEAVVSADGIYDLNQVAKLLNFKDMGRNTLFAYLREKELLRPNNQPYQYYMKMCIFETKIETYDKGFGPRDYVKTYVTVKGLEHIRKMLLDDGYELNS